MLKARSSVFVDRLDVSRPEQLYKLLSADIYSCIMQDSAEDWTHKARLVAKVYGSTVFTIAATAAQDGRPGLFHARDPTSVPPVQSHFTPSSGTDESWYAQPGIRLIYDIDTEVGSTTMLVSRH